MAISSSFFLFLLQILLQAMRTRASTMGVRRSPRVVVKLESANQPFRSVSFLSSSSRLPSPSHNLQDMAATVGANGNDDKFDHTQNFLVPELNYEFTAPSAFDDVDPRIKLARMKVLICFNLLHVSIDVSLVMKNILRFFAITLLK